jgi:hypothetical protein
LAGERLAKTVNGVTHYAARPPDARTLGEYEMTSAGIVRCC